MIQFPVQYITQGMTSFLQTAKIIIEFKKSFWDAFVRLKAVFFYPNATSITIMAANPSMTPMAPKWKGSSSADSGINSEATTKIMAPAAPESNQGMAACTFSAKNTEAIPKKGSTAPETLPKPKERHRLNPLCRMGREMAVPSGRF